MTQLEQTNKNVDLRLSTFLDKNIKTQQMYFNINRILLIILIVFLIINSFF